MTPPEGTTGGRRLPLIGAALAALLLLLAGLAGAKSLRDLKSAHEREQNLEDRISATHDQIDALRNRIERLRSDPGLLERLAREELGFVRPKDVIIELPLPAPAAVPAVSSVPPIALDPLGGPVTEGGAPRRPAARRAKPSAPIVLPPSDAPPLPE
ncbi:MAG TPA: septum formation initiator family protein [Thermoanaerobaculia bacterium]|nr:septum formation initiator family protein [Thermoanaerobaculia bacterium]